MAQGEAGRRVVVEAPEDLRLLDLALSEAIDNVGVHADLAERRERLRRMRDAACDALMSLED